MPGLSIKRRFLLISTLVKNGTYTWFDDTHSLFVGQSLLFLWLLLLLFLLLLLLPFRKLFSSLSFVCFFFRGCFSAKKVFPPWSKSWPSATQPVCKHQSVHTHFVSLSLSLSLSLTLSQEFDKSWMTALSPLGSGLNYISMNWRTFAFVMTKVKKS